MGIPKKSSRKIVVEGKPYRWMARSSNVFDDDGSLLSERVLVTFQEDTPKPGPPVQRTLRGCIVTPADVADLIRQEKLNSR